MGQRVEARKDETTQGASWEGWRARCRVSCQRGTRTGPSGRSSLSRGGGVVAGSCSPEDTWEKWETASQARGTSVWRQRVNQMALGRSRWDGLTQSSLDREGAALTREVTHCVLCSALGSGRTSGTLPSPRHPRMVGHPEQDTLDGLPSPTTPGDEGTDHQPSHTHHGACLAPPLRGPFDGGS